jgi:CheY-like chemotaxis protein
VDQLDGARVLVVDDSTLARTQMARQLDTAGAEVTAVGSAAEAIAALAAARYDVLVCDLRLQDSDGFTLVRAVRKASPGIAAIAITAHADDESRRQALAAGFDDFIPKLVSALLVPSVARLRAPR